MQLGVCSIAWGPPEQSVQDEWIVDLTPLTKMTVKTSLSDHCSEITLTPLPFMDWDPWCPHWPRCRTPLYAHIWRSLMSSILSPYLGMPIYGHIVVINPYDRLSLTRTIDSSIYGARAFNCSGQIMGFHSQVWPRCRTPLYAHIWRSLMSSLLSPYLGFMPIYGDPSFINIKPISGNAHIWTYCSHKSIWPNQTMIHT